MRVQLQGAPAPIQPWFQMEFLCPLDRRPTDPANTS